MLNYGELQILKVFKNTLLSHLYWVVFSIDNLRLAVDTAKRIHIKEISDRQLGGQSAGVSPFLANWHLSRTLRRENF